MNTSPFTKLLEFTAKLEAARIAYRLEAYREGAISVTVAIPGEHWEIDFLDDGSVDVECFRSDGVIHDESMFEELFAVYADSPETAPEMNATNDSVLIK
jgi:hypothetical protein